MYVGQNIIVQYVHPAPFANSSRPQCCGANIIRIMLHLGWKYIMWNVTELYEMECDIYNKMDGYRIKGMVWNIASGNVPGWKSTKRNGCYGM
jgi:hypothetical protein